MKATRAWRGRSKLTKLSAAAGALLFLAVLAAPATATPARRTFKVLGASESWSVTSSEGCLSGHRSFTGGTVGAVPENPESYFSPTSGEGVISTRPPSGGSPTTGQYSASFIDNSCEPCHYDYGTIESDGGTIAIELFATNDPDAVKITTSVGPAEVGDVTAGLCGGPIPGDVVEGSSTIPTDQLLSGKPVTLTIAGGTTLSSDSLGRPASIHVDYDVSMRVQASGGDLQAVPGGPYSVVRAGKVKLDGSGSKPKSKIEKYKWSFKPIGSECPAGTPAKASHKEGKQTSIVALCDVKATLTVVARNGDRDTASTTVNVKARGGKTWRTPFSQREVSGDPRTPHEAPSASSLGGGNYAFSLFGGLNVSDCGRESESSEILCPLLERGSHSWLGSGYELDKVDDPDGPFDGYSYVVAPEIKVKRAALINPAILPGSVFYKHNQEAGRDVAGFVKAVREHEGLGGALAHSGHGQAMKEVLATASGDPRRVIEQLFAPERGKAKHEVDSALHRIERKLDAESEDPLAELWSGEIDFYDSYQHKWIPGQGFEVPGPMRG
ncbi:MAG TPA: hypothetical protein VMT37_05195 [Solirubrobacterales bacterium]|nr:hypothetical protein [Solirubrobacterales bacterium]